MAGSGYAVAALARQALMVNRLIWTRGRVVAFSTILLIELAACSGPALTPLQAQYQRGEERALRYHARGELPQALQAFQNNLRWAEIADNRSAMMAQALNVGAVALALGEGALAEQSFAQARQIAARSADRSHVIRAQLGLAQVALRRKRFEIARAEFQQALAEARELRDVAATLVALNGLGLVQKMLGEKDVAREHWREAEVLARAVGEKRLLGTTLANQATLDLQTGDVRQAILRLEEAIALDRETENLPGLAQDLALLGRAYEQQGDQPNALQHYQQARTIVQHTGQRAELQRYNRETERLERELGGSLRQGQLESIEQEGRFE